MQNDLIYKWNYIPTKEKEDGYQDMLSNIHLPSTQQFILLSQQQQDLIIKNLIKQIRKINIFPIFYFNEQGIKKQILSVINKNDVTFNKQGVLDTQSRQGSLLLDYLFPNLHHMTAARKNALSVYDRFYDDDALYICLMSYLKKQSIHSLRTAFFSRARYLWNTGTNYLPIRAKVIYERFCPKNGIIYDYSAGFGGRMLGALSSNYNFTYIAVQPNTDTYYNLLNLGRQIEKVTNRKDSFHIHCIGSQDFIPTEKIDFAFSCPPFYDLEIYSNQNTQSIIKFPEYNNWLEGYVRSTIKNCFKSLKDDGIYAVDLMNFYKNNKYITLIEDWINLAIEQGFYLKQVHQIKTRTRKKEEQDKEKIFVFTKNKNLIIKNQTDNNIIKSYEIRLEKAKKEKINRQKTFCVYNVFGKLIKSFTNLNDLVDWCNYPIENIKKSITSKKRCNQYYFRVYKGTETILDNINNIKKVICKVDNIYFDTYAEAGRYLKVSRQAVQQARDRKSKKINNYEVIWY